MICQKCSKTVQMDDLYWAPTYSAPVNGVRTDKPICLRCVGGEIPPLQAVLSERLLAEIGAILDAEPVPEPETSRALTTYLGDPAYDPEMGR